MAARESLLSVRGVSLAFAGVQALTDVSFDVERGSIAAVIGPNGAGKSSLLNVVSGVYRADSGIIRFDGAELPLASPRECATRGIARTFQNIALFRGMSVLDNVMAGQTLAARASLLEQAFGLGRVRHEERTQRERAEELLELLRIQRYRAAFVGKLSYGLQKRVELARALAASPRLLLLDEPMAGMNATEKEEMSRFILEANRALDTTIVLIEHDMGVVMDLSSRVIVLDYGRLLTVGTPAEVQADPRVIEAYLGVDTTPSVQA